MKKAALLLAAILLLMHPAAAACLVTGEAYGVGAAAAIVMEAESGEVLFAQEIHRQLPMASTTKIMTALLTLEQPNLHQEFTVDETAIRVEGSSMGLRQGDTVTLYALAVGMLLASGNDAAGAAAVRIFGSMKAFVAEMNSWVQSLGCKNTHFVNPDGLHDPNHYSTAADLAKITLKALQNDTFERISTTVQYKYKNTTFTHTNLMLQSGYVSYYYEYASGIKTGSTEEAGYCVITKASKDGYNYLAVVLGAPVIDYNNDGYVEKCSFIDAASLFDWAFDSLKYTTLVSANDVIDEVPVENGKDADAVQLMAEKDVNTIVPAGLDKSAVIIRAVDKPESVQAPVEKGQKICKAEIVYADQVVATVQLVAANRVELSTFLKILNAVKAFFSLTVVRIVLGAAVLFVLVYLYLFIRNARLKKKRRAEKMRQYEEMQTSGNRDQDGPPDLPPPVHR